LPSGMQLEPAGGRKGTLLQFNAPARKVPRSAPAGADGDIACEVVIFPGVRIERHDLDLSHRVRDSIGQPGLDGGGKRPRRTS
jgi:hypothetical protein